MKKFIAVLLLTISMFSFFILYNEQKELQIFNMKNAEHHLKNSYEVIIPSRINSLPRGQQYRKILDTTNGEDAAIYFTRIDQNNSKQKIIKYIYTTNDEYMSKFNLVWGKKLDKTLMDTHYFLSTEDTGDKNQIGRIASFDGVHMEIRTLQNMLDEGLFLDGPCTVTVPEGKSIDFFTDAFKEGLAIKSIDTAVSKDIGEVKQGKHLEVLVLFFIIMLLVLYDILKSYKNIAVEKLLGFSDFDIWKKRIVKIMFTQIVTMIVSIIIMSFVLFKKFNIYHLYFLKDLALRYIILIIIMFIISSVPFIYVKNIKVSAAIKNKQPAQEILFFNTAVKIFLCVGFIFLVNRQVADFENIKRAFDGTYKRWEEVTNYRVLNLHNISLEMQFSNTNIEIYKIFNKSGAIFAAFDFYTKQSVDGIK